MGRRKVLVADLLRSLAGVMRDGFESKDYPIEERVAHEWYCRMCVVADMIDAEHERRMNQMRRTYKGHIKKRAREYATKHERELERDNAKLLELVADVHEALCADKAGMFHKLILASMEDGMRELGVEVPE